LLQKVERMAQANEWGVLVVRITEIAKYSPPRRLSTIWTSIGFKLKEDRIIPFFGYRKLETSQLAASYMEWTPSCHDSAIMMSLKELDNLRISSRWHTSSIPEGSFTLSILRIHNVTSFEKQAHNFWIARFCSTWEWRLIAEGVGRHSHALPEEAI